MSNAMVTNKEIICDMLNNNTKDLAAWIYYIVNNGCHGRPNCPAFTPCNEHMFYICEGGYDKEKCVELWDEWLNKEYNEWLNKEYTRDMSNNESE